MRLERRPEKTSVGKNVQEIWIGTKAQAPKMNFRKVDSTRLDAWYQEKTEQKKKLNETRVKNAVGSEA